MMWRFEYVDFGEPVERRNAQAPRCRAKDPAPEYDLQVTPQRFRIVCVMIEATDALKSPAQLQDVPSGFDPRKDFAPIGLIASMPVALLAHPSFPGKTLSDVIALAKQQGGKLNIGSSAIGTGSYLSAELFKSMAGVDAAIIPYKGTAQLMNDLLGNHVPIAFGVLPPALGNLQSGTLRAIAVLSPVRFSLLPDVPTAGESGLPGFVSVLHYGLLAPAGTPRPIIERLNKELRAVVDTDALKQRIQTEGGDPLTSTPDEYANDIDSEERKWATLIRKLSLKVE